MQDIFEKYTADIDLFLVDVCMSGAMYGLEGLVGRMAQYLTTLPRTQGATWLAHSLAKTVVKDYNGAIALAQKVLLDEEWALLHGEAQAFERLATQLQKGEKVEPWDPTFTKPIAN